MYDGYFGSARDGNDSASIFVCKSYYFFVEIYFCIFILFFCWNGSYKQITVVFFSAHIWYFCLNSCTVQSFSSNVNGNDTITAIPKLFAINKSAERIHFNRFSNSRANKTRKSIYTHIVLSYLVWYGVVCILSMVGGGKLKKKYTTSERYKKKFGCTIAVSWIADYLLLREPKYWLCACAINTRPFTSFHLHESAFVCERTYKRAREREREHARVCTHMTISEFAHIKL